MGRMKEVCIQIINDNGGIPEDMTIGDVSRMRELEIYNWREYERQQEKTREQFNQSENPGETGKIEEIQKKFTDCLTKTKTKRNKQ